MISDPVVEEIHRIREELLAKEGNDLRRFIEWLTVKLDVSGSGWPSTSFW